MKRTPISEGSSHRLVAPVGYICLWSCSSGEEEFTSFISQTLLARHKYASKPTTYTMHTTTLVSREVILYSPVTLWLS